MASPSLRLMKVGKALNVSGDPQSWFLGCHGSWDCDRLVTAGVSPVISEMAQELRELHYPLGP